MIDTKVVIVDRGKSDWDKLLKSLGVKNAFVTIGVHGEAGKYTSDGPGSRKSMPSVAEVALWNEFGTTNTPERSFIRSTIDEALPRITDMMTAAYDKVLEVAAKGGDYKASLFAALSGIGFKTQVLVQNKIKSNVPPPLSKATIDAKEKKHSLHAHNTLMDTELLLRSVTNQVTVE